MKTIPSILYSISVPSLFIHLWVRCCSLAGGWEVEKVFFSLPLLSSTWHTIWQISSEGSWQGLGLPGRSCMHLAKCSFLVFLLNNDNSQVICLCCWDGKHWSEEKHFLLLNSQCSKGELRGRKRPFISAPCLATEKTCLAVLFISLERFAVPPKQDYWNSYCFENKFYSCLLPKLANGEA